MVNILSKLKIILDIKKSLILIGDVKALQQGIRKIEANRKTILKNKLIEYITSDITKLVIPKSIYQKEQEQDEIGSEFLDLKPSDFDF